jgi:hypothetical protein
MSDNSGMDKDAYIKQLEAEVAKIPAMQKYIETLEKRIAQMEKYIEELERRLGINSQNSSKPPSSDPPGAAVVLPKRCRRKRGARYVERILTVGATCRLQGRSLIEYLREACRCHLHGLPSPSLFQTTCLSKIA